MYISPILVSQALYVSSRTANPGHLTDNLGRSPATTGCFDALDGSGVV